MSEYDPAKVVEMVDLRDAVVEAAVVMYEEYRAEDTTPTAWKEDYVLDHRLHALFCKVKALQEARDG